MSDQIAEPMVDVACDDCLQKYTMLLSKMPVPFRCRRCRMARFGEAVSKQLDELEDLVVAEDANTEALGVLFLDQVKELQEKELEGVERGVNH